MGGKRQKDVQNKVRAVFAGIFAAALIAAAAFVIVLRQSRGDEEMRYYGETLTAAAVVETEAPAPIEGEGLRFPYDDTHMSFYVASMRQKALWHELPDGTVEYRGKKYRRNTYVKAVLLMGVDRHTDMTEQRWTYEAGQCDGIFLAAQDTARNKVKVFLVPRDTMTVIDHVHPDGSFSYTGIDHLTLAFPNGDGYYGSCEKMVEAVSNVLCDLKIDHYLASDLGMINTVNDMVGGVTVTIPRDGLEVIDPTFVNGATVTLHGGQAERFLRSRDQSLDNTALMRMQQHRTYMLGFYQALKAKSKTDPDIVTELFDTAKDYMLTDMQKGEYMKLALDALGADGGLQNEDIVTLSGTGLATGLYGIDAFYLNYDISIPYILDAFYREV